MSYKKRELRYRHGVTMRTHVEQAVISKSMGQGRSQKNPDDTQISGLLVKEEK